jgi:hypothetical protein
MARSDTIVALQAQRKVLGMNKLWITCGWFVG